jgi:carbon-monoxide dehydrogenase small subunit
VPKQLLRCIVVHGSGIARKRTEVRRLSEKFIPSAAIGALDRRSEQVSHWNNEKAGEKPRNERPDGANLASRRPKEGHKAPARRKPMPVVSMTVNGRAVSADVDPRTLLVQFIRENLLLTGTHVGCDTSQCGACTVHLDGHAVKSCTVLALQAEGCQVTTIEGLAASGALHPMQEAFRQNHGLQCGFCTPGMIMAAVDIVQRNGNVLDEHVIRDELEGNICRCTGYHNIVAAITDGARAMATAPLRAAAE